jgi:hypothetical protein
MLVVARRALQRSQRSQAKPLSLAARPPHRATALAATHNFLHHHSAPSLAAPRPPNARTLTTQKPQEPEPPRSKLAAFAALARVDAPAGTLLLYWPGAWSIALAAPPAAAPDASLLALFGVGAFVMRGAGCTINDIWDRDVDGAVARTRRRPLASGELAAPEAAAFLAGQDKGDSTSLQRECSARARSGKSIHASRALPEMIARPKISRNEWKLTEIGAFEVGNFAPFSCPGSSPRSCAWAWACCPS